MRWFWVLLGWRYLVAKMRHEDGDATVRLTVIFHKSLPTKEISELIDHFTEQISELEEQGYRSEGISTPGAKLGL